MKKSGFSGFYLLVIAMFVGMLFINSQYFRGSSNANIGIAHTGAFHISSERSCVVKKIHVVPGEQVRTGALMIEMENNALEIDIIKLQNLIGVLKKEKQEKASLVQSKIAYYRAEGGIVKEEINAEIQQIESEIQLNKQLTEQFAGSKKSRKKINEGKGPQVLKISSLEERKKLQNEAVNIKIDDLVKDHSTEMLLLDNEIDLKERELELLLIERQKLLKYAAYDGVIESVAVRSGEEVDAFVPLITVNPIRPTSVVAYVLGARARQLAIGTKVSISSYDRSDNIVEGEVIGYGAINELPDILQKSTAVKAFGKEVFIKIPEENYFASGEKVLIR